MSSIQEKKKHVKSTNEKKKLFQCDSCKYSCDLKYSFTRHVETVHEKKKQFKCELCDVCCSQMNGLKKHIRAIHKQDIVYKCNICEFSCPKTSILKNHVKMKHKDEKMSTVKETKKHFISVNEKKEFQCELCEYSCDVKWYLTRHIRSVHEKINDFKCQECGSYFSQTSDLKRHVQIVHEGKKPFKCDYCHLTFSLNCNKKRHVVKAHPRSQVIEKANHCQIISTNLKIANFKLAQVRNRSSKPKKDNTRDLLDFVWCLAYETAKMKTLQEPEKVCGDKNLNDSSSERAKLGLPPHILGKSEEKPVPLTNELLLLAPPDFQSFRRPCNKTTSILLKDSEILSTSSKKRKKIMNKPERDFGPNQPRRQNGEMYAS